MTDRTADRITDTGLSIPDADIRKPSSLRVSTRIARFLTAAVIVFAITTVGFAFWITREHNQLAATGSQQMVRGGLATQDEHLKTITMDYAIWPEAMSAINEGDVGWVWENIGVSAAVTETTDLMLIVPPRGEQAYGWVPGMTEEPGMDLLDQQVFDRMQAMLDEVPIAERRAVIELIRTPEGLWLLSAARIVSDDPAEDPAEDEQIPRLIFGFKLNEHRI